MMATVEIRADLQRADESARVSAEARAAERAHSAAIDAAWKARGAAV